MYSIISEPYGTRDTSSRHIVGNDVLVSSPIKAWTLAEDRLKKRGADKPFDVVIMEDPYIYQAHLPTP